jgi:methyl-accepting chemotaxis protein
MTISKKIFLGYLLTILFTIIVAVAGLYILEATQDSYRSFIDVNQRLVLGATQLRVAVLKKVEGYRGFLLYGEESYLEHWTEGINEFKAEADAMRGIVSNPQDQRALEEIIAIDAKWVEIMKQIIGQRRKGQLQESLETSRAQVGPIREDVFEKLGTLIERQNQILSQAREEVSRRVSLASTIMIIVSFLALIFGLAIAFLLTRTIARQLRESIALLSSSSAQIVAVTTQLAAGAVETATSVNETTATVEEVKQTVHVSTQKAKHVSDSAQKTTQVSKKGRTAVAESEEGMSRIKEQMQSIAESIVKLSEQSQAIGEIIATVTDLAEQSNLLAVNAAIEAAKAGEQGRGFTVVAQEVRSMAEQSKQATLQVRVILNDIKKAMNKAVMATEQGTKVVESGVKLSKDTGEVIRTLSDSITESAQAATQISTSSQQQLVGMDQIALAMDNIKQATTQNMAGAKQAEQAAQELNHLGQRLRSMIESRSL